MKNNNTVGLIVAVTIGLIMTGLLLVPVVNDAMHSGAEEWSNGSYYMTNLGTDTAEMIISDDNVIVSDGDTINGYGYQAIVTDTLYVAVNNGNINMFYYANDSNSWSSIAGANVTIDGTAKTVTFSDITHASANDNIVGDTLTVPYSQFCVYRTVSGNIVGVPYASIGDVKVNNDDFRAVVYNNTAGVVIWNGTDVYLNGTLSETPGTVTLVETADPELYTVSGVTYGEITAAFLYVPGVVYGEAAVDDSTVSLMGIIPVFVILALLMIGVKAVLGRNNE